jgi:hypothetical protein
MAGDAAMQPAGSESLSELAELLNDSDETKEEIEGQEGGETEETESHEEEAKEEEGEEDEQKEEPTVTIKHDGKEVTLKQSEALELAQQGFDYTKKTMALAEDRKGVEAERQKAEEASKQHEQVLSQSRERLTAFITYMQSQVGEPPNIALAQQDAAHYLAQKQLYEDRRGQLNNALEAVRNVDQESQRARQARIAQQADATEKELRDTIPGWNDNTLSELAAYLGKSGLTPQAAADAYVHKGLWEIANKAKAYDAIVAKKAELKPVSQLAKVQKPSASNQPNRAAQGKTEALKRYAEKPTLDNLAKLL